MRVGSTPWGLALGALLAAGPGAAFPADEIRRVVEELARDEMRGRGLGSEELARAGASIERRFEAMGLEAGFEGSWRQGVPAPDGEELAAELFNVAAKLSGEGEEYLVVGAHYDGLGVGGDDSEYPGEILNGADDNASGVAALVRIARALAKEKGLQRTVYFVAFTGEETGRLGSEAFVESPPAPLENAVAMLNLDTVGRVEEERLIVFGTGTAEQFPSILTGVNYAFGFDLALSSEGAGASDHASFFAQGLPVLHFFSGAKAEVHRPGDDVSTLDLEGLVKVADFVAEVARYLAETEAPLDYRPAGVERLEAAPETGRRQVSLGSIPDFSRESGGILLSGVMPGSAAAEAGLAVGDVLVELGGAPLDDIYDFQAALASHEPGERVIVKFQRGGALREVEVTLRARR